MNQAVKPSRARQRAPLPPPVHDLDAAKLQLAVRVAETLRTRHLTQAGAAVVLGVDQPKVSRLMRGVLAEFSTSRLLRFLTLLGANVEIVIHPAVPGIQREQPGGVRVVVGQEEAS